MRMKPTVLMLCSWTPGRIAVFTHGISPKLSFPRNDPRQGLRKDRMVDLSKIALLVKDRNLQVTGEILATETHNGDALALAHLRVFLPAEFAEGRWRWDPHKSAAVLFSELQPLTDMQVSQPSRLR